MAVGCLRLRRRLPRLKVGRRTLSTLHPPVRRLLPPRAAHHNSTVAQEPSRSDPPDLPSSPSSDMPADDPQFDVRPRPLRGLLIGLLSLIALLGGTHLAHPFAERRASLKVPVARHTIAVG